MPKKTDETTTPDAETTETTETTEATTPVEAAEAEATADETVDMLKVPFRGQVLEIPRDSLYSARRLVAMAGVEQLPHVALFETVGADQAMRLISACAPGDNIFDVAREFFEALGTAVGAGNS